MFPSRAIVAGATGLIGRELTTLLAGAPAVEEIKVVTRRPTGIEEVKEILVDFDQLKDHTNQFTAQAAYCCLGTTMKKAGSREMFFKVDHDYVISFAEEVFKAGVRRLFLVSSMGASENSAFYYSRVKGQTESKLKSIGFEEIHIMRPSLLLGARDEKRVGESIAQFIMTSLEFMLIGPLRKYRPIQARAVARAMIKLSERKRQGVFIHESEEIKKLAVQ
jgi:uncharacterized protein YbjT (DUF2867 family)